MTKKNPVLCLIEEPTQNKWFIILNQETLKEQPNIAEKILADYKPTVTKELDDSIIYKINCKSIFWAIEALEKNHKIKAENYISYAIWNQTPFESIENKDLKTINEIALTNMDMISLVKERKITL